MAQAEEILDKGLKLLRRFTPLVRTTVPATRNGCSDFAEYAVYTKQPKDQHNSFSEAKQKKCGLCAGEKK
jgi:hypothetical protein